MAEIHILVLVTWTLLQAATLCDSTGDTCVVVRPCDGGQNIGSLGSTTDKKLSELQAITEKLQAAVDKLTKQNVRSKVGFSASLAVSQGSVRVGPGGSQNIVLKNVFINTGNAYNPATGIFTAPLKGAFQFTFTTFGYRYYYSGAKLLKNGRLQVTTWQSKGKHHSDSTSGAAILPLNAGDKVNLVNWGNTFQVFDNYNHHTTFSGVLLYPL